MRKLILSGRWVALLILCGMLIAESALAEQVTSIQNIFLPLDVSRQGAMTNSTFRISEDRIYVFYLNIRYRNEEERKKIFGLVGKGGTTRDGQYADPGDMVPVHLKITTSTGNVIKDISSETKGISGHMLGPNFSGEYFRRISTVVLKPGLYRMEVTVLQDSPDFQGVECAVSIGIQPHTRPLFN